MKDPNRFDRTRLRLDHVIARFFGTTAVLAIVVLALITIFLFREGGGFFPQSLQNLRIYRLAGLEYVEIMRDEVEAHTVLNRSLQDLRMRQVKTLLAKKDDLDAANAALAGFDQFAGEFDSAVDELRGIVSDLTETVTAIKEKAKLRQDALQERDYLLAAGKTAEANAVKVTQIDFKKELQPVRATYPVYRKTALAFRGKLETLLLSAPVLPVKELQPRFEQFRKATRTYLDGFPLDEKKLEQWNPNKPVPWYAPVTGFLLGTQWITNSFWQDWFGVLPLLTGSLMVASIALAIAVPMGICAAIYVSEMASSAEKKLIKPYIEFISAIPSVVLGFFGVAVLGEAIRAMTRWEALSWVSAFPIAERLNAFTAGCLLALMAIPTIFSLSEDALNSVPRSFKEASYALGATRLQTVFRVLVPAAISGIVSAILLGFGRVIGETMVVLLCAGNRIEIPKLSEGLAALFQPVHTMTGIVAQEIGEVPRNSIHWQALFMVGLLLFFISLLVNWLAQRAVRRFKVSIG